MTTPILRRIVIERGGPGSGFAAHAGRPGQVGGSAPGGGAATQGQRSESGEWHGGEQVGRFGGRGFGFGTQHEEGQKADAWGLANARGAVDASLAESMLHGYTGVGARPTNAFLRRDAPALDPEDAPNVRAARETIRLVDQLMGQSSIAAPVIGWRSFGSGFASSLHQGDRFLDKGFVSTTLLESKIGDMTDVTSDWKAAIQIPQGTRGYYIGDLSVQQDEVELLLDRGQTFEVMALDQAAKEAILRVVPGE